MNLKELSIAQQNNLANDIRAKIITACNNNGGHLASNLGVVELTIALHTAFNPYSDRIIFDVSHQCYTHKILTGRDDLTNLRKDGYLTGFTSILESDADVVTCGHASTSLSVALGLAAARDVNKQAHSVVAVIGDGALGGGMAFEALNDIGASGTPMIIILNDNKMSISKNVGALSKSLAKVRLSNKYFSLKNNVKRALDAIPFFGKVIKNLADKIKQFLKFVLIKDNMFEQLGIKYIGPLDGHNISSLVDTFNSAKDEKMPVLIHVITQKGHGYNLAKDNPEAYHGLTNGDSNSFSFSAVAGKTLCELIDKNNKVTAITAAMASGTGLDLVEKVHKSNFYDVGIAEQHAVTMAAGQAKGGLKPFVAIYSTFLQRAYDQIFHDVCLNNLPVTLLVDRAGAIGSDGVTHQGLYDLSFLSSIPNLTIAAPCDGVQLKQLMQFAIDFGKPLAIRYPKNYKSTYEHLYTLPLQPGKWQPVQKAENAKTVILAVGNRMLDLAVKNKDADVYNCVFVKPLDTELLNEISKQYTNIVTLEDNTINGGFGSLVSVYLNSINSTAKLTTLGFADEFVHDLTVDGALKKVLL